MSQTDQRPVGPEAPRGTAGLEDIPFDEILTELGESPVARMLLQALEASRDATDWAEQASTEHAALAGRHATDRARILAAAADAGAPEWKARARADLELADRRERLEATADERQVALEVARSRREELLAWAALAGLVGRHAAQAAATRPRATARR